MLQGRVGAPISQQSHTNILFWTIIFHIKQLCMHLCKHSDDLCLVSVSYMSYRSLAVSSSVFCQLTNQSFEFLSTLSLLIVLSHSIICLESILDFLDDQSVTVCSCATGPHVLDFMMPCYPFGSCYFCHCHFRPLSMAPVTFCC